MEFLLNPNVAYVILLAGVFLAFLAVITPGTGILEIGAVFCFLLAGYAVYNLSINAWALLILFLSIVPYIYSVQKRGRLIFLGISLLMVVVGSVFLFDSEDSWFSVNPLIALIFSSLITISLWLAIRKSIEVITSRPAHDLDALVGQVGEAKSVIHQDGNIYVGGELWSARSKNEIPAGSQARVLQRDGFTLVVENIDTTSSSSKE
jgi:membrane-bound serine protease (ClpP class)